MTHLLQAKDTFSSTLILQKNEIIKGPE